MEVIDDSESNPEFPSVEIEEMPENDQILEDQAENFRHITGVTRGQDFKNSFG